MTIGERYDPAMRITDPEEARAYFDRLVAMRVADGVSRAEAEDLERSNLGYYAVYFGRRTAERVNQLFSAGHPVFGRAWPASPEEVVEMAAAHVERLRAQREEKARL